MPASFSPIIFSAVSIAKAEKDKNWGLALPLAARGARPALVGPLAAAVEKYPPKCHPRSPPEALQLSPPSCCSQHHHGPSYLQHESLQDLIASSSHRNDQLGTWTMLTLTFSFPMLRSKSTNYRVSPFESSNRTTLDLKLPLNSRATSIVDLKFASPCFTSTAAFSSRL